jgi:3-deoxy-manno-octulosonate cytidylyltransferase (CMP-KDO synthetase)
MPEIQIVLPARLASTRLSEKLLQKVGGKSVLQHTYEAASRAACASSGLIVAADDQRIVDEVASFGGRWVMTPRDCPSGTDRIAHVARQFPETQIFVNVQSDEPEISPSAIDAVARALADDVTAEMATAGTPIVAAETLHDPGVVKIVMADYVPLGAADAGGLTAASRVDGAGKGRAVYFSRACVPFDRDGDPAERLDATPPLYWHHLGLYAYRRDFLNWFAAAPPSPLEKLEKLEQLRAIEGGKKIVVAAVGPASPGIDTAEDLEAFRRRVESGGRGTVLR